MDSEWYTFDDGLHNALMLASGLNKADIVKVLLEEGASPNAGVSRHYDNPFSPCWTNSLHWASYNGNLEIVQELLKHPDIDLSIKTEEEGETALYIALKYGYSELVEEFLKHPDSFSYGYEIYWALRHDDTDVIMEALKSPNFNASWGVYDEDARYTYGNILTIASKYGNAQVVEELLKRSDVNPNSDVDWSGSTPLIEGVENGSIDIVKLLLNHPFIDPNVQNMYNYTALHYASNNGHSQAVQELLKHPKTDKTITNIEGQTAWDIAKPKIREQFPELKP